MNDSQVNEPIKILYVAFSKTPYSGQLHYHVVTNRSPVFVYERMGQFLYAKDGGFYSAYKYDRPSDHFKAFAGKEFDIPLKDGTIIHANGQWWDGGLPADADRPDVVYVGRGTPESLRRCYVYCSAMIEKSALDAWLAEHEAIDYWDMEKILKGGGK